MLPNEFDTLSNPPHDRYGHRITQGLVTLGIRRMVGSTPRHVRIPVGESLESFAFDRCNPSYRKSIGITGYALVRRVDEARGVRIMSRKRRCHITVERHVHTTVARAPYSVPIRRSQRVHGSIRLIPQAVAAITRLTVDDIPRNRHRFMPTVDGRDIVTASAHHRREGLH